MARVLKGLVVYPDNMLWEIIESRGCYASSEAKEVLRQLGIQYGLAAEDAYRIIQLAAFNACKPTAEEKELRENPPGSLGEADAWLHQFQYEVRIKSKISIQEIIFKGELKTSSELEATEDVVQKWNQILKQIFADPENVKKWYQIFQPSYLLKNEAKLYQEIIGV